MATEFPPPLEDEGEESRPGSPVDARRVVRTVLRGKYYLLAAAIAGALIGVLAAKFGISHSYVSSATVRFEGMPGQSFHEAQRELPSLTAMARTESFLQQVRNARGLGGLHIDAMRALLSTTEDSNSGLVEFIAYGDSPENAAGLANTAVEHFIDMNRARRNADLLTEQASVQERADAAAEELQAAQNVYDAFRESNGITNLNAEQETVIEQAADLRTQADLAAAEVRAIEARITQLREALADTPRMERVSTGGRSRAQNRLGELSQSLREARGRGLGDSHPQVQALERQVRTLRAAGADSNGSSGGGGRMSVSSIYSQMEASLSGALTELEEKRNHAESLAGLAATAEARANHSSEVEVAAARLLADVNSKGELVSSLIERAATIEDLLRDVPTGFRSVAAAVPPENPVRSKKKKVVAVAVPALMIFVVLSWLLGRELWGLRLATPGEVAWWAKAPVLTASEWPERPEALYDLITDLEELTIEATGEILMLGLGDEEQKLARRIIVELTRDWGGKVVLSEIPTHVSVAPAAGGRLLSLPPPPPIPRDAQVSALRVVEPVGGGAFAEEPPPTGPRASLDDGRMHFTSWDESSGLPALRRRARRAQAVIVIVRAGVRAPDLFGLRGKLGREDSLGFVMLDVDGAVTNIADRAGPVDEFAAALAG